MEITRATLGIAVGIAGTLFLGYCVYFDQQRRKDPLFKKKLRERKFLNTLNKKKHEQVDKRYCYCVLIPLIYCLKFFYIFFVNLKISQGISLQHHASINFRFDNYFISTLRHRKRKLNRMSVLIV